MIGVWGYNEVILTMYSQLREEEYRELLFANREGVARAIEAQLEFARIQNDTGTVSEYVNEGLRECFELVKFLDSDDAIIVLNKLSKAANKEVEIQILLELYNRTESIDADLVFDLCANPLVHLLVLEAVEENPKLKNDLDPALFDQQEVAKSLFLSEMDWGGPHEEVRLLETREVKAYGEKSRVYIYQYRWSEETGWVLGVSGPQPIKKKTYSLSTDYVYTNWESYDPVTYNTSVETLLEEIFGEYE